MAREMKATSFASTTAGILDSVEGRLKLIRGDLLHKGHRPKDAVQRMMLALKDLNDEVLRLYLLHDHFGICACQYDTVAIHPTSHRTLNICGGCGSIQSLDVAARTEQLRELEDC